jgi:translocation and assembly module TamA
VTFDEVSPAIDEDTARAIGLVEPYRIGAVEESVAYDRRDHPLDPTRGFMVQVVASQGGRDIGGTSWFSRATGEVRGYLPIGPRLVLAVRGLYGRTFSPGLPVTERFFGGGASGHRGFGYRALSPFVVDEEGNSLPIGGEEMVLGSGEARVAVANVYRYPFGVVGFFDAGDVTAEVGGVDLGHLHHAVGLGLRWDPIVSIRFDVGYRINRTGPDEPDAGSRFAFHVSLGQAF